MLPQDRFSRGAIESSRLNQQTTGQREVRRKHEAPAYATGAKCCGKDTWRLVGDLAQGSFQGAEVAGAKRLDARLVITIELRDGARAARSRGLLFAAEPQPKMEGVHRGKGRVLLGVEFVHLRRFHAARSKHEELFTEDASGV